ncbi:hypothetical protein [Halorubrum aethiopicum]|uniref:hypothetical protein n=1 Tax=Halorubrum aethiopicum TaxID=1758255 RepID=UPI000AF8984B|nr:hypothetical protein [Halorubrum aethiopicum]
MADRVDLNRLKSPGSLLVLGTVGFILLILTFIIEVRIIFENPAFGDITDVFRVFWSLILAVATLGSFALAVHSYRRDDDPSGPPTQFSVRGRNHDIDFHVHIGESDDSGESEQPQEEHEEAEEDSEELRPDPVPESEKAEDSDER